MKLARETTAWGMQPKSQNIRCEILFEMKAFSRQGSGSSRSVDLSNRICLQTETAERDKIEYTCTQLLDRLAYAL